MEASSRRIAREPDKRAATARLERIDRFLDILAAVTQVHERQIILKVKVGFCPPTADRVEWFGLRSAGHDRREAYRHGS